MPNARTIPILNLKPDQKLSGDQIVLVANGELQVLTGDGEKIGIILRRKDRALLIAAIALEYASAFASVSWLLVLGRGLRGRSRTPFAPDNE